MISPNMGVCNPAESVARVPVHQCREPASSLTNRGFPGLLGVEGVARRDCGKSFDLPPFRARALLQHVDARRALALAADAQVHRLEERIRGEGSLIGARRELSGEREPQRE